MEKENKVVKSFIKYPSLRNIGSVDFQKMGDDYLMKEVYATEKLHGTNTGVYVFADGTTELASRTRFVGWNTESSTHSGLDKIVDREYFSKIGVELIKKHSFQEIVFFGEHFGKSIFSNMGYSQVKENRNEFRVFAIVGLLAITEEEKVMKKLSQKETFEVLDEKYLAPLEKVGTVKDVLGFCDVSKDSTYGGLREGFVVMPTEEKVFTSNQSFALEGIKIKANKFSETKPKKENTASEHEKLVKRYGEEVTWLVEDMHRYVTKNRMKNILSKGKLTLTNENLVELGKAMQQDILEEYENVRNFSEKDLMTASKNMVPKSIYLAKKMMNDNVQDFLGNL